MLDLVRRHRPDQATLRQVGEQRVDGPRRFCVVDLELGEQAPDRAVAPFPRLQRPEHARRRRVEPVVALGVEVEQDGFVAEMCREDFGGDVQARPDVAREEEVTSVGSPPEATGAHGLRP